MAEIQKSLHGRSVGIDRFDNLVAKGAVISGGGLAPLAAGATRTLTSEDSGRTIALDTAAGSVVTLPAATGSGCKFRFEVSVLATSNSHKIQVANSSDTMRGGGTIADTDTAGSAYSFFAAAASDTITLNRSTTGSVTLGEWIEVADNAANLWTVSYALTGTGTPVTPFSAAV